MDSSESEFLVVDLEQITINKKNYTKELKSNNDKLTEVVEERRAKQLRFERLKLERARLVSALAAQKGHFFDADATDRRLQEEDDRRKQLVVKLAMLQNECFHEKQKNQKVIEEWKHEKSIVFTEMTKERETIVEKTSDKKHQINLMREELARLKRVKAQMENRTDEHSSMVHRADEEKRAQEARVKDFIRQMYTMENGEIARNLDEYKKYYFRKLHENNKQELENLARERNVMAAKCMTMEKHNLDLVEKQAELVQEIDQMKKLIKMKRAKEEELLRIMKAVHKSNNESTQKYTDMIERLQVERHKINEEIQRLLIELRNVLASIAHLQTEINHYWILLNPHELIVDFETHIKPERVPSPVSTRTPSPVRIRTPSPVRIRTPSPRIPSPVSSSTRTPTPVPSTIAPTPEPTPEPTPVPSPVPTPPRSITPVPSERPWSPSTMSIASSSSGYQPGRFYQAGYGLQGEWSDV